MKKVLFVLSLALMVTAAAPITAPPLANGGGWGVVVPDCYTFTVDNASSDSIGTVTINGLASSTDFNVVTTANYQQTLRFVAVSATVNGVTISYPNSSDVQLASGVWVKVGWQSSSLIEIANIVIQNSPVRR